MSQEEGHTALDGQENKSRGTNDVNTNEQAVAHDSADLNVNGVLASEAEKDVPQPVRRGPPPPPNGGYGWVCTVCCGLINAHTWGLNSSYGVFLAHYLATNTFPNATSLEYAFVGSLSISCAMLVSPAATYTTRVFGTLSLIHI